MEEIRIFILKGNNAVFKLITEKIENKYNMKMYNVKMYINNKLCNVYNTNNIDSVIETWKNNGAEEICIDE